MIIYAFNIKLVDPRNEKHIYINFTYQNHLYNNCNSIIFNLSKLKYNNIYYLILKENFLFFFFCILLLLLLLLFY